MSNYNPGKKIGCPSIMAVTPLRKVAVSHRISFELAKKNSHLPIQAHPNHTKKHSTRQKHMESYHKQLQL